MRPASALALAIFAAPAVAQEPPPGAVACTGCHGLFDGAPYPIHQLTSDEIATALAGFREGTREGTVMPRLAAGFDAEESRAISEWFAAQDAEEQGDPQ